MDKKKVARIRAGGGELKKKNTCTVFLKGHRE